MLASCPPSRVNQITADLGIPNKLRAKHIPPRPGRSGGRCHGGSRHVSHRRHALSPPDPRHRCAVSGGPGHADSIIAAVELFEKTYEALYGKGSGFRQAGIELTTFRVEGLGRTRKPVPHHPAATARPKPRSRPIFDAVADAWIETPVWKWQDLPVGERVSGPAMIEHPQTAVHVATGQAAVVDTVRKPGDRIGSASMTASPKSTSQTFDPITFEVIRHKLQAITEEQAITLKSISGSPVVTDATDFNNGLYLADGSIVTMGPQVIFHTGTMSTVIRSIIERYQKNPGIRDGDMFILNDPYKGAIHQPDVSIVAPIFSKGRLIAWAGSCAHQLDTGGMSFGSWAYSATDVQQEAMLLPGVKIVENGEVREDIWQMIMGMTRLPDVVGLDLKGMIAANNVAARRLHELFDRYGEDTVVGVMHAEIDASERSMRERLRSLPDGIYRARDYIDHDGLSNALYRVCLAVEKRGDELTFDMTGTSPQAPGFINCTWSGMKGALLTGLLPILAPDIRWNEGVLRPVTIRAPEGIVCNAKLAGAGFGRDHFDRVDRDECRGRSPVASGQHDRKDGGRGAGRDQGPNVGPDLRRARSRRQQVRRLPARFHGGRRRRLDQSGRSRRLGRL